jgi:hypothetical protein
MRTHYIGLTAFTLTLALTLPSIGADNTIASQAITYPYYASPERTSQIKQQYKNVKSGMDAHSVQALLGNPDEDLPLYEPHVKNSKLIGRTHWYLIQRLSADGSVQAKSGLLAISCG